MHLAGITQEGPFAEMVGHNSTGTHHVLEAPRRQWVPSVVLASSHHVTGLNPVGGPAPLAPDSFYAVSKVTAEALGHLYAHQTKVQVVAVRIGSYRDRPTEPRHRATWLSPRDATALLCAATTRPLTPVPHRVRHVCGTSDNRESWWPRTGWDALGYQPADNADQHPGSGPPADRFVGGAFTDDELPT